MKVCISDGCCQFSGDLNELASEDTILDALNRALKAGPPEAPVQVDFSALGDVNSIGLRVWMRVSSMFEGRLNFVRAPLWLVLSSVHGLLGPRRCLESFLAPFEYPKTGEMRLCLLTIGKDLPLQKDYSNFTLEVRDSEGVLLEPAFWVETLWFRLAYYHGLLLDTARNSG